LFSWAVTEGIGFVEGDKKGGMKLDFIDVRRAYFHAQARRQVFVELCEEDRVKDMCGELVKAMYGTRDAAQNWEVTYVTFMNEIGFVSGKSTPCVFYHEKRNVRAVVHGDDFTLLGKEGELDWFRQMISERFEVKFRGRLGPCHSDQKSIRILNRVVEWSEEGIRYEADQRHAEIIVKHLGLEGESRSMCTPGVKGVKGSEEEEKESDDLLESHEATMYRAIVARGIYLAQDRSDIAFAVKELSRRMSSPDKRDWQSLKRLGRYLLKRERAVISFCYQSYPECWSVWVDSDWAGCHRTRKSTSGGVIMSGSHMLKSWSTTQQVIALSSGEAEYYSMVRGGSMGLGIKSMSEDMGVSLKGVVIKTDASAAKGIASRRGLGKVRHIDVSQLWLQDRVGKGDIVIEKVSTHVNLSDALTKHVDSGVLGKHMISVGLTIVQSRHELMPES
jgi:hypothetical protein